MIPDEEFLVCILIHTQAHAYVSFVQSTTGNSNAANDDALRQMRSAESDGRNSLAIVDEDQAW